MRRSALSLSSTALLLLSVLYVESLRDRLVYGAELQPSLNMSIILLRCFSTGVFVHTHSSFLSECPPVFVFQQPENNSTLILF